MVLPVVINIVWTRMIATSVPVVMDINSEEMNTTVEVKGTADIHQKYMIGSVTVRKVTVT